MTNRNEVWVRLLRYRRVSAYGTSIASTAKQSLSKARFGA